MEQLSLRQLEYAVAVDDAGAICAAAKQIRISQPSLSQQIRQLEITLGVALFERNPAGTETTEAGHAFLVHARNIIHELHQAREAAALQPERPIRVGIEEIVDVRRVLRSAADAFGTQAGKRVRGMRFRDAESLSDALLTREIDLAVGSHRPEWADIQVGLGSVALRVMASADHAETPLTDSHWIRVTGAEGFTSTAMAEAGLSSKKMTTDAEGYEYASAMVEQGFGVALLPERMQSDTVIPVAANIPAIEIPVSLYATRLGPRAEQLLVGLQREFSLSAVRDR